MHQINRARARAAREEARAAREEARAAKAVACPTCGDEGDPCPDCTPVGFAEELRRAVHCS